MQKLIINLFQESCGSLHLPFHAKQKKKLTFLNQPPIFVHLLCILLAVSYTVVDNRIRCWYAAFALKFFNIHLF